ncbi:hypothetical protein EVAR_43980_1 [Eumeta japonica]|uniref:Uncharacterized protein n=1 Tax=Eumeta variegata TaxID=151549 RepID=A0A4C1XEJ2_EUMVA|nr:hypothetical protein EVAR_43980_1 [Eumeta japonica]
MFTSSAKLRMLAVCDSYFRQLPSAYATCELIRDPILSQEASNVMITLLGLQASMSDGHHPLYDDSPPRLSLEYAIENIQLSK